MRCEKKHTRNWGRHLRKRRSTATGKKLVEYWESVPKNCIVREIFAVLANWVESSLSPQITQAKWRQQLWCSLFSVSFIAIYFASPLFRKTLRSYLCRAVVSALFCVAFLLQDSIRGAQWIRCVSTGLILFNFLGKIASNAANFNISSKAFLFFLKLILLTLNWQLYERLGTLL